MNFDPNIYAVGRFEMSPNGHPLLPIVDVHIGSLTGILTDVKALIDTGAQMSVADPAILAGLATEGNLEVIGMTGSSAGSVVFVRMLVGSLNYEGPIVASIHAHNGVPLVLGMDVLRHVRLEVNASQNRLTLFKP